MIYNRFPCYGAMICFEGRKNYREKKETKVKSRCGTFESSIGFIDLTEVLKNLVLMVHQCFDIFFRCGDRCNAVIFHQIVQNIRRQECRKRRTKTDVFDTQV